MANSLAGRESCLGQKFLVFRSISSESDVSFGVELNLLRPCPVYWQLACAVGTREVAMEAALGLEELLNHHNLSCV